MSPPAHVWRALTAAAAALFIWATPASAQGPRAVGLSLGVNDSRQLISRQDPSETRTGLLGGAFIDVETPAGIDVLAEAYLVQRGGKVALDEGILAEVEADYLAFGVYPKLRVGVGPASLYALAGPYVEMHLRTRAGGELAVEYREPATQVFGVSAGAGLEVAVVQRYALSLEIRHDEGLGDAFPNSTAGVRHRTVSVLLRLAKMP